MCVCVFGGDRSLEMGDWLRGDITGLGEKN